MKKKLRFFTVILIVEHLASTLYFTCQIMSYSERKIEIMWDYVIVGGEKILPNKFNSRFKKSDFFSKTCFKNFMQTNKNKTKKKTYYQKILVIVINLNKHGDTKNCIR